MAKINRREVWEVEFPNDGGIIDVVKCNSKTHAELVSLFGAESYDNGVVGISREDDVDQWCHDMSILGQWMLDNKDAIVKILTKK